MFEKRAAAKQDFRAIESNRSHLHSHFAVTRQADVNVAYLEYIRIANRVELNNTRHFLSSPSFPRKDGEGEWRGLDHAPGMLARAPSGAAAPAPRFPLKDGESFSLLQLLLFTQMREQLLMVRLPHYVSTIGRNVLRRPSDRQCARRRCMRFRRSRSPNPQNREPLGQHRIPLRNGSMGRKTSSPLATPAHGAEF